MKLHPASVPYRSLSRSVSTGSMFFFIGVFTSPGGPGNLLVLGAMVLFGVVLGVVYEVAYYQRFRYELTDDTFDVASGVVSRRDREVPLRRIQNVDVRQNVLQRILHISAVHVETAGGGQTEVTLEYVGEDEARRLQRRLRDGSRAESDESDEDEAPEELLFEIRPTELALLSVFTIDPGASVLGGIILSFLSGFDPVRFLPVDALEGGLPGNGLFALAWGVLLFVLAAWVVSALLTFSRYYGFTLTRVDDELHYERGLIQRYSGTIPLDKVQTLTIKESVPFRWIGYGSLAVETAGYAPGQSGSRGTESAIPLAERNRVFDLARSVEPFEDEGLERTPLRSRERYAVRYVGALCVVMALGYGLATYTAIVEDWHAVAALLFVVPIAAHLKWKSRGYRTGKEYFHARTGFWRRTTKVVPYYRIQSVVNTQTIFQRRRQLASVTADTASSASFFGRTATAIDVDATRGAELQRTLGERLQERLQERKHRRAIDGLSGDESETSPPAGATSDDATPASHRPDDERGGSEDRRPDDDPPDEYRPDDSRPDPERDGSDDRQPDSDRDRSDDRPSGDAD